jgi:hypothetical protein
VLKPAVAQRFIRIEQGRLKYGDRPDATLNALVEFFSEDARFEDVIEALKAANPETDEAAEKIADEARRNAQAERDGVKADEVEAATTKPTVDTKTAPTAPIHNERTAEASAAERKREYAAKENDEKNDGDACKPFPDMPFTDIKTIGELQEYIEEALRRGVSREARFYIEGDEYKILEDATVYFSDDEGPDGAPPFMIAKGNADDAAEPDITTTTKVERTVFNKALKKAGHDLRKVKLSKKKGTGVNNSSVTRNVASRRPKRTSLCGCDARTFYQRMIDALAAVQRSESMSGGNPYCGL